MKLFYFFLASLLLINCERDKSPMQPSGEFGSGETYQVYSAVLNSLKKDYFTGCVLIDSTQNFSISERKDGILENMPGLQVATVNAYISANQSKRKINEIPNLRLICHLVNSEKAPSVFDLKTEYPDAQALVELSNVGFNADKTQALVYFSQLFAPLAGHGSLVLLVFDGEWHVQQTFMVWIS